MDVGKILLMAIFPVSPGRAVGRGESHDGSASPCSYRLENGLSAGWPQATFQSGESAKEKALAAENASLKARVGTLVMDNDLLSVKITRLENGVPIHLRKSSRPRNPHEQLPSAPVKDVDSNSYQPILQI
jgi:hypothetical protein